MGQVLSLPFKLINTTQVYWRGLFHYLNGKGRYEPYRPYGLETTFRPLHPTPTDSDNDKLWKQYAQIHLFSLASNFYLYHKPHYRKGSYRDDLIDNLRNVAIPGTGIPLSWMATSRLIALPFLLFGYPTISYVAAIHQWFKSRGKTSISHEYKFRLLAPNDWFSYWRHNCNVVGLHALLNDMPDDYEMENKWTFLKEGRLRNVPVSPFLDNIEGLVVKHRNEEGGMGIYFYKNAVHGGDWILQEKMENAKWVQSLLPENAPLSTFRVITCSRASIHMNDRPNKQDIKALSCVFRAGRAGAATDHDSILFDVDVTTGKIRGGTTNAHWYRLGIWNALLRCIWRSHHDYTHHPDCTDIQVTGYQIPDIQHMLELVGESHLKLCPYVPLAGWDVVFSTNKQVPICLLEVNLSCNFFRGSFDQKVYLDFMDDSFAVLQEKRLQADAEKKKFRIEK